MTTTWNPSDKDSSQTLSNGNLTVTGANNSDLGMVRSVDSIGSNKVYWEVSITTWNKDETVGVGVSPTSETNGNWLGEGTGDGFYADTGHVYTGAGVSATYGSSAATPTLLCFAEDGVNSTRWMRIGTTGNWNNSGTADPTTNTGGRAKASLSGMKLAVSCGETGESITAHFSSASWTGTAPSGFGEINSASGGANVSGATNTITESVVAGVVAVGVAVSGATVSITESVVAGVASIPISVNGATDTVTVSVPISGTVTLGNNVSGATNVVTESVVAGTATSGVSLTGVTDTVTVSVIAGSVGSGASVSGAVLSVTESVVAGTVSLGQAMSGATNIVTESVVAGTASVNVSPSGAVVIVTTSVIPGSMANNANVSGATDVVMASVVKGTATTGVSLTGATVSITESVVPGTVAIHASATGQIVSILMSVLPGAASAQQGTVVLGSVVTTNLLALGAIVIQDVAPAGAIVTTTQQTLPPSVHGGSLWVPGPPENSPWSYPNG